MNLLENVKKNNPEILKLFESAFRQNKLSHAFLFYSSNNAVISNEPKLLINSIINDGITDKDFSLYSDLVTIDGSKGLIKKEKVLNAMIKMNTSPLDKRGKKILFIKNIENGNKQSLNSLLKFIEEPWDNTYIIMTTNKLSMVLSTIKSRSQIINVLKNKISNFSDLKIDKKYLDALVEILDSKNKIEETWKENEELIKGLFDLFNKKINKYEFQIEVNKLLKNSNYELVINILRYLFVQNIYNNSNNEKIIKTKKTLEFLSDFIFAIKQYSSFDLEKTKLLIEIGDNYE